MSHLLCATLVRKDPGEGAPGSWRAWRRSERKPRRFCRAALRRSGDGWRAVPASAALRGPHAAVRTPAALWCGTSGQHQASAPGCRWGQAFPVGCLFFEFFAFFSRMGAFRCFGQTTRTAWLFTGGWSYLCFNSRLLSDFLFSFSRPKVVSPVGLTRCQWHGRMLG